MYSLEFDAPHPTERCKGKTLRSHYAISIKVI